MKGYLHRQTTMLSAAVRGSPRRFCDRFLPIGVAAMLLTIHHESHSRLREKSKISRSAFTKRLIGWVYIFVSLKGCCLSRLLPPLMRQRTRSIFVFEISGFSSALCTPQRQFFHFVIQTVSYLLRRRHGRERCIEMRCRRWRGAVRAGS